MWLRWHSTTLMVVITRALMSTHSAQALHLTRKHSHGYSPRIPSQISDTADTHYTREKPIGLRRFFIHRFSRFIGTTNT
ncbi:uncharacterized protein HD556DRAFT_422175 [Suillus plorans]|uniref:Secreted protein n=1 Tax=Suillus plorans TaxID=116603 RepID=A0A9P7AQZ5_9AGAM|nr:uncharacterized protein HD556DRAFT_422175 [Suillus plorans]KAG1794678.1 hypothetical protein HD556DRAFT_422175 [Suillus plorans]